MRSLALLTAESNSIALPSLFAFVHIARNTLHRFLHTKVSPMSYRYINHDQVAALIRSGAKPLKDWAVVDVRGTLCSVVGQSLDVLYNLTFFFIDDDRAGGHM